MLNSNLVNLSGIMPSSTENRKKVADYPDGFSQNNIKYIVSIIYRTDISAWVTLSDGSTTFYLMADGIYAYTSNTNFSQKQFKLALCKWLFIILSEKLQIDGSKFFRKLS